MNSCRSWQRASTTCFIAWGITLALAAAFIGNWGAGNTLDALPRGSMLGALIFDLGLLGLAVLPFSPAIRFQLYRFLHRLAAVALFGPVWHGCTAAILTLVLLAWKPVGGMVWVAEDPLLKLVLCGVYLAGWVLLLPQLARRLAGQFPGGTPGLRFSIGCLLAVWAAPTMTLMHLLLAVVVSVWLAAAWEDDEEPALAGFNPPANAAFPGGIRDTTLAGPG